MPVLHKNWSFAVVGEEIFVELLVAPENKSHIDKCGLCKIYNKAAFFVGKGRFKDLLLCCCDHGASRGRITFDSFTVIIGVEKVDQRVVCHPGCSTLLFN